MRVFPFVIAAGLLSGSIAAQPEQAQRALVVRADGDWHVGTQKVYRGFLVSEGDTIRLVGGDGRLRLRLANDESVDCVRGTGSNCTSVRIPHAEPVGIWVQVTRTISRVFSSQSSFESHLTRGTATAPVILVSELGAVRVTASQLTGGTFLGPVDVMVENVTTPNAKAVMIYSIGDTPTAIAVGTEPLAAGAYRLRVFRVDGTLPANECGLVVIKDGSRLAEVKRVLEEAAIAIWKSESLPSEMRDVILLSFAADLAGGSL